MSYTWCCVRLPTDGHARGKAVRVEDDVRDNARLREGHVDQQPYLTAYPLLSCATGKLVTNYGILLSKVECSYHGNLVHCQLTKQ